MGTKSFGSFNNTAICCKLYISIKGAMHNKHPRKWPVQNKGEIWSWHKKKITATELSASEVNNRDNNRAYRGT